jgi:hypothetical protein
MVAGGGLATVSVVARLAGAGPDGVLGSLLAQPAIVTVPVAFVVMVAVSRATAQRIPTTVGRTLMRLHAPERLGLGELRRAVRSSD